MTTSGASSWLRSSTYSLDLLVIQEDGSGLLNRYTLKDPSDFIYHTLNTMKQLDLDRETIPVYLSGIVHENMSYTDSWGNISGM